MSNISYFSGNTQPGNTAWVEYSPANPGFGLYVEVDISHCGFISVPVVVTTLHGNSHHWELTGTSSVYSLTERKFRVYVKFPTFERGKEVKLSPTFANGKKWHVHWIASGPSRVDPPDTDSGDRDR